MNYPSQHTLLAVEVPAQAVMLSPPADGLSVGALRSFVFFSTEVPRASGAASYEVLLLETRP